MQVPISITDADDIVTFINQWVQDEPSVAVKGITLALDADCPTMLASFDSDDCKPSNQTSPSSSSSSSSSPFSIIIGAAVAAVVVNVLIIVIIIIVVCHRRKSTYRYCKVMKCAYHDEINSTIYIYM